MEVRRGVAGPRPFSVPAAPGELEPAGSCGPARPGPGRGLPGAGPHRFPSSTAAQAHPNPRPCGRSSKRLKKEKIRKKRKRTTKKAVIGRNDRPFPSRSLLNSTSCWGDAQLAAAAFAPTPIQPRTSPLQWRESAEEMRHTTVVNVLKMAAAAAEGGGWGSGGGRQCGEGGHRSGDRPTGFRPGPEAETPRGPSPMAHMGPRPRSPSHTPPPRPPASDGVRRSRHYARGITVSNCRADPTASLRSGRDQQRPPLGPSRSPPPYRP